MLATIYLVFNEGYLASGADSLTRAELSREAIRLGRVLAEAMPGGARAAGAAGADAVAGLAPRGAHRPPTANWSYSPTRIASCGTPPRSPRGSSSPSGPVGAGPSSYTVQALIAAEHARAASAAETNWARIVRLYAWLAAIAPSPVVELNRAVAVAMADGPHAGLELIDAIDGLDAYGPFHVARADLLRRLGEPRGDPGLRARD